MATNKRRDFIYMRVRPSSETAVIDALRKIPEVIAAYYVPGEWDIKVIVETKRGLLVDDINEGIRVVLGKIRTIKGVEHTKTEFTELIFFKPRLDEEDDFS